MSEIEEVQEQMKAEMEAMKEQVTIMMEAMMSMRKMMELNMATVIAASTATEVDPTQPSGINQAIRLVSDMVGQGGKALGSMGGPHFVQVPQPMGEIHEVPRDHTSRLRAHLRYATEGQAFGGVPLLNTLGGPQYLPQPQPLHFEIGGGPPAMHESSKEYAQRWRDLAAQVVPPMMEREMITMIVDTLPVFYYEKMTTYMPSSFADLVFAGKRIEVGLKSGKFDYAASMNSSDRRPGENGGNKKEGETHVVAAIPTWPNFPLAQQYQYSASINPSHYPPLYQPRTLNHPQRPPPNQPQNPPDTHPRPNTTPNTNQNTNQGRNFLEKKHVKFTPLPMTYADLLPYLLNNAMAVISQSKISQPPFPRGYNPNMTCGYHRGVPGHSIEHCMTLKHKVQSLIDVNWLRFEEENRS
ncbi:hypothetical protein HKD37_01G000971 [Glycine soja]